MVIAYICNASLISTNRMCIFDLSGHTSPELATEMAIGIRFLWPCMSLEVSFLFHLSDDVCRIKPVAKSIAIYNIQ